MAYRPILVPVAIECEFMNQIQEKIFIVPVSVLKQIPG